MSRGYGKYRRGGGTHASFHFDNLFKENSNRPSAARSAATVGKWGITSFTSIRTLNGLSRSENEAATPAVDTTPKPKKFFKSRNTEPPDLSSSYSKSPSNCGNPVKKPRTTYEAKKTVLSSNVNKTKNNEPPKPPIVLRICRGKSQLLNDSDESESTPTPSSTPSTSNVTSPRALRDTTRPTNCRITRSARRSMQQDPSSSPATADTPGEFSLFMSPKEESDLSPQYIPAEKYELERKAMYDNLLRPNSPKEDSVEPTVNVNDSFNKATVEIKSEVEEQVVKDAEREEREMEIEENITNEMVETIPTEVVRVKDEEEENEEEEDEIDENSVPSPQPEPEPETEPQKSLTIDEEWSTDTDSNSTAPELEVKQILPDPSYQAAQPKENKEESQDKAKDTPPEPTPPVKLAARSVGALYRHKWTDEANKTSENVASNDTNIDDSDFSFKDDPLTRIPLKKDDEEVTSVKCTKGDKGYYTVVRNVKKAHQIQEIGEFQEFNDDVEYILDALQDNNPISTRCLSAITLASKCMVPAFRMHVRAHGTVAKFFKALHDATKDQSLGLCTATVMFVLSQDRLNMDLDRDCLELMLNLLESDVSYQQALDVCGLSSAQLEKNKQKVRELCAEIQSQGHAMHLNLESITRGEWFKEELRELGGLEHIMKTIHECCRQVSDYVVTWTDTLLDKLRKVDRCLRVLENVTHNNEENQTYILKYNEGVILDTLVNLYKLCDGEIPLYPVTDITDKTSTGTIIREALLVTLKVLINLTHHFNKQSIGSQLIGSRPGIIETSLHLLLQVPLYIPEQKKFELGVLVLMLLINLIQDQEANKNLLMEAKAPSKLESIYSREESAVEALIAQFYHWEGCAKLAEKKTNAILDGEKDGEDTPTPKSNEEFIEETVAKLLQKAGTHMEYTFLASYIVMLIGFLIMENKGHQNFVRQFLKGNNFADMVELLTKFFKFMNLTASTEASSVCAIKDTEKVIKFLEECDKSPQSPEKAAFSECTGMDLSYRLTP
ncbi:hypothetical protein NQ318_000416 [Aromia moschata]|uniref:WAPL domain-containing protein n=1 Tax=Aromia moschata TaxID=1265417 RepID=A0AAV8YU02_9CUCU|nr:hypothetical protein NQ318_000416 [Aromia moschata]